MYGADGSCLKKREGGVCLGRGYRMGVRNRNKDKMHVTPY